MTRRRFRTIAALAFVGTWLALAINLVRSEGDSFIGLALIALTPMVFVALFALPNAFRVRSPHDTLRVIASPLVAVCMATSFFLLATVVGGTLWGWVGGLAGVMLGALLATQIILAMSQIRRATSGAPRPEASLPNRAERRKVFATAVLSGVGFALSLVLLGGFGYLLSAPPGLSCSCVSSSSFWPQAWGLVFGEGGCDDEPSSLAVEIHPCRSSS